MIEFKFIIEDTDGAREQTAQIRKADGAFRIVLASAVKLPGCEPCAPCSAERLAEYLNNVRAIST